MYTFTCELPTFICNWPIVTWREFPHVYVSNFNIWEEIFTGDWLFHMWIRISTWGNITIKHCFLTFSLTLWNWHPKRQKVICCSREGTKKILRLKLKTLSAESNKQSNILRGRNKPNHRDLNNVKYTYHITRVKDKVLNNIIQDQWWCLHVYSLIY